MFGKKYICGTCGAKITPAKEGKGNVLILILLLFLGVIPGLIYLVWMLSGRKDICPKCKSYEVISIKSPRGKQLLQQYKGRQ
jgi:flagellar basal body-associated protein FliL